MGIHGACKQESEVGSRQRLSRKSTYTYACTRTTFSDALPRVRYSTAKLLRHIFFSLPQRPLSSLVLTHINSSLSFPPLVLSDKEDEAPPHNQTDPNPDSGRPRKASTRLGHNNKTFSSSGKKKRGSEKKRGLSLSSLFFCVLFPSNSPPPSPPFSFYPQLCALRALPYRNGVQRQCGTIERPL